MTFIKNIFYLIIITNITHAFHIQVAPAAQHVKKTRSLNYAQRKLPILKSAVDEEQDADADAIDSNPINTSSASKIQSLKFVKLTKQTEPALLADYLMEIGASSVAITDHDADTENENPIFAEPAIDDDSDIFAAVVCGDAAVGKNVWMRCDVTAHFGESYDPLDIVDNVRTSFDLGVSPRYVVDEVPDLDWIHEVQSNWKPCVIGGFVLRLPWHSDEDVLESVKNLNSGDGIGNGIGIGIGDDTRSPPTNVEDYVQLLLEGGLAFGTGEHPTTQLCLEWITNLLKKDANANRDGIPVNTFLDYGAGSGVLGMAACKLNNDDNFKAVGVEIDSDAIRIADANALKNQVSMKSYLPSDLGSDDESASLIMKAIQKSSVETLPKDYNGPCFDACAANILAGPLISLSETIASMLKPGAKIGISGILAWQGEDVVEAYSEYFNDVKVEKEKGGWVLVSGTKK